VEVGDVYLLCSDGLNDMVDDEQIGGTVSALRSNISLAVGQLVKMANDNGGRDNVSVILVKVNSDFPASRGFMSKVRAWFRK
jgi:serine/threonine protein phosphatase PrpC